jgi:hypothetical protein
MPSEHQDPQRRRQTKRSKQRNVGSAGKREEQSTERFMNRVRFFMRKQKNNFKDRGNEKGQGGGGKKN